MRECLHRLCIVAAPAFVALAVGVSVAGAGASFPDPAGDVHGGAGPDLTTVSISHTASTVTFAFRFAKAPPLAVGVKERWVDMLLVLIDVPPRSLKQVGREWSGADYYLGTHGREGAGMLVRAPKTPSANGRIVARPKAVVSGRTLRFSLRRAALGDPGSVEFVVAAGRETSTEAGGGEDFAPDDGTFHYQLR